MNGYIMASMYRPDILSTSYFIMHICGHPSYVYVSDGDSENGIMLALKEAKEPCSECKRTKMIKETGMPY